VAVSDDANAGSDAGYMNGDSGAFDVAMTNKTGRDLRGKGLLQYVGGHYLRFAGSGEYFLKQGPDAPADPLEHSPIIEVDTHPGMRTIWGTAIGRFKEAFQWASRTPGKGGIPVRENIRFANFEGDCDRRIHNRYTGSVLPLPVEIRKDRFMNEWTGELFEAGLDNLIDPLVAATRAALYALEECPRVSQEEHERLRIA